MSLTRTTDLSNVELRDGRRTWCYGFREGLPVWKYGTAPAGLVTKNQLREQRLRRSRGQDPVGLLVFRARSCGEQVGELFRIDQAVASREKTPRWQAAIDAMNTAHHTCRRCGSVFEHYLPTSTWKCWDCMEATNDFGTLSYAETTDHPFAPSTERLTMSYNDRAPNETTQQDREERIHGYTQQFLRESPDVDAYLARLHAEDVVAGVEANDAHQAWARADAEESARQRERNAAIGADTTAIYEEAEARDRGDLSPEATAPGDPIGVDADAHAGRFAPAENPELPREHQLARTFGDADAASRASSRHDPQTGTVEAERATMPDEPCPQDSTRETHDRREPAADADRPDQCAVSLDRANTAIDRVDHALAQQCQAEQRDQIERQQAGRDQHPETTRQVEAPTAEREAAADHGMQL